TAFRRPQKGIPAVPGHAGAEAGEEVLALRLLKINRFIDRHIVDADIFEAEGAGYAPVFVQLPADRDARAQAGFPVFVEDAVIVIGTHAQAVEAVKQERFAPAHRITLQLRAGDGFRPELLAGPAKRMATQQIIEAGRAPGDVEVALIEGDRTD